jgi:hypothetical protein
MNDQFLKIAIYSPKEGLIVRGMIDIEPLDSLLSHVWKVGKGRIGKDSGLIFP